MLKYKKTMRPYFILLLIFTFNLGTTFSQVIPGAYQTDDYLSLLKNKRVGIVSNQSSLINKTHLVDSLLSLDINIIRAFAPEHGFRGKAEAGAHITDGKDSKTGIEIISLYGKNKKPSADQLKGIEVMVFDLQGVGLRFYTYISTLSYVMEACAENDIPVIVLDRPNPNGHYIDGPVLQKEFTSFVGLFPIPVVYGMTDGELAQMINGEQWLKDEISCDLTIVNMRNYNHNSEYQLPIKPSPNLPNFQSIYLYASLCFFEGTPISIGRGTNKPFQQIGYPKYPNNNYAFTPKSIPGVSAHPKFENQKCYGINLSEKYQKLTQKPQQLDLSYLISFYESYPDKADFFNAFFKKLAGTNQLQQQIIDGLSEAEIRQSWQKELDTFKLKRAKYLLYE